MKRILSEKENKIFISDEARKLAKDTLENYKPCEKLEEEFTVKYKFQDEASYNRLIKNMEYNGFRLIEKDGNVAVFAKSISYIWNSFRAPRNGCSFVWSKYCN